MRLLYGELKARRKGVRMKIHALEEEWDFLNECIIEIEEANKKAEKLIVHKELKKG